MAETKNSIDRLATSIAAFVAVTAHRIAHGPPGYVSPAEKEAYETMEIELRKAFRLRSVAESPLSEEEQERLSHIRARCIAARSNGYQWTPTMLDRNYLLTLVDSRLTASPSRSGSEATEIERHDRLARE